MSSLIVFCMKVQVFDLKLSRLSAKILGNSRNMFLSSESGFFQPSMHPSQAFHALRYDFFGNFVANQTKNYWYLLHGLMSRLKVKLIPAKFSFSDRMMLIEQR